MFLIRRVRLDPVSVAEQPLILQRLFQLDDYFLRVLGVADEADFTQEYSTP